MIGKKKGRLTVVGFLGKSKHRELMFVCSCRCGNFAAVCKGNLNRGITKSCGCLKVERLRLNKHARVHGKTGTLTWSSWEAMHKRCKPSHKSKKYYYDRGIRICERWFSFEKFLSDMGRRPGKKYSLDRINNDRGYEPNNCRWATHRQQVLNQRRYQCVS